MAAQCSSSIFPYYVLDLAGMAYVLGKAYNLWKQSYFKWKKEQISFSTVKKTPNKKLPVSFSYLLTCR